LWPERAAHAALCPGRVLLRRAGATREFAVAGEDWGAALKALPDALGAPAPRALYITLSHHFVRYALLPWNPALTSAQAWRAYAEHRLAAIYGPPPSPWALRVAASAPRGARIACAVDRALLETLRAALGARGVRLASAQPHLMRAFNRERRALGGAARWLVVEEAGRLALALIERGAWRVLRCRRVGADWRAALPGLLEREAALLGMAGAPTPLIASALA
jgi:hypothetical protein